MTDGEKKEKLFLLESQWRKAWRRQCWDRLDEVESEIAEITGETDIEVNRRLYKTFIKNKESGNG